MKRHGKNGSAQATACQQSRTSTSEGHAGKPLEGAGHATGPPQAHITKHVSQFLRFAASLQGSVGFRFEELGFRSVDKPSTASAQLHSLIICCATMIAFPQLSSSLTAWPAEAEGTKPTSQRQFALVAPASLNAPRNSMSRFLFRTRGATVSGPSAQLTNPWIVIRMPSSSGFMNKSTPSIPVLAIRLDFAKQISAPSASGRKHLSASCICRIVGMVEKALRMSAWGGRLFEVI